MLKAQSSKRLSELDVLRGLAVLAVIACHYTSACAQLGHLDSVFRYGAYGPHLFFVISGFVIFLTLQGTKTAKDFVVSRFSRLFPVYWIAVIFAFVAIYHFPLPDENVTLPQAIANMTMLQTWLNVPDIDVSYWTLGVELKFYAVMLGLFILGLLRRIDLILGLWLAAILGYWASVNIFALPVPRALAMPLNVNYGQLFIAGIVFYLLKTDGGTAYRHAIVACCLAAQAVIGGIESALVVLGVFALFYCFVYGRLGWIVCRPLVFLGSISYALYVFHHPVGNIVILNLRRFTDSSLLMILSAFVASLLAAVAATYFVEKPAMAWIRGKYKNRRRRDASAASRSSVDVDAALTLR